jgi:hypothetical protein
MARMLREREAAKSDLPEGRLTKLMPVPAERKCAVLDPGESDS